jgi:competence protein ComEA
MEAEKRVLFEIPLDLNTVSTKDLLNIPGIGPETAQAIIAHRRMHGEFASLEALKNVKGIGPKRFRSIKRFLSVKTYSR